MRLWIVLVAAGALAACERRDELGTRENTQPAPAPQQTTPPPPEPTAGAPTNTARSDETSKQQTTENQRAQAPSDRGAQGQETPSGNNLGADSQRRTSEMPRGINPGSTVAQHTTPEAPRGYPCKGNQVKLQESDRCVTVCRGDNDCKKTGGLCTQTATTVDRNGMVTPAARYCSK